MTHPIIQEMLQSYSCQDDQECVNALREIMQSVALLALSRSDFFNHAAFYGGTALRLLYGLHRGSEDMDFSLLAPNSDFDLSKYAPGLEAEFASYGLTAVFSQKLKIGRANIQSGFLKSNTRAQMLSIGVDVALARRVHSHGEMKIKIEVDVQPPPGFDTEIKYLHQPVSFPVRSYVLPDLLAGKLHAVLFRSWKSRVKGRDWYDLAWYAGRHPEYRLSHLERRARQSGDYDQAEPLTAEKVHEMLVNRLAQVDMQDLKTDVRPFVADTRELEVWNREFFMECFQRLLPIEGRMG